MFTLKHHVKGHSYTFWWQGCDSGREITTQSAAKEISYDENVMALEVGNWVEPVACCASGLCVWFIQAGAHLFLISSAVTGRRERREPILTFLFQMRCGIHLTKQFQKVSLIRSESYFLRNTSLCGWVPSEPKRMKEKRKNPKLRVKIGFGMLHKDINIK